MTFTRVTVPAPLLMASGLSKSAKLVWMMLRLPKAGGGGPLEWPRRRAGAPGHLHALAGVARSTTRTALSELERGGWLAPTLHSSFTQPRVTLPIELLTDKHLGIQVKLLYGMLQLTPGFHDLAGQFTYASLSALAGLSFSTAKRGVTALSRTGWLQMTRSEKFSPIHFTLGNPAVTQYNRAVKAINRRRKQNPNKGESLMHEYLSAIINSDEYDDNMSPAWLLNPFTGEELQFDRYYWAGLAWEFNGPQHYDTTELYPDEDEARKQRARDFLKADICKDRGIPLVVVHSEDLRFATMRQKVSEVLRQNVGGVLRQRDLRGDEPVIAYLDLLGRTYRENAAEGFHGAAPPDARSRTPP
ncbi:MAG: hypothetical protein JWN15_3287 [Firmicutes bacterium]|nr:hypothetical protein [Bacillota bacterium]